MDEFSGFLGCVLTNAGFNSNFHHYLAVSTSFQEFRVVHHQYIDAARASYADVLDAA
jgi:hypothetical protein